MLNILLEVLDIKDRELFINEEIRHREVRVIGEDGAQLGIMKTSDALALAYDKNLDLVEIAPQAAPPVCRIMDYGKYRFEQSKKEKEARKNQRIVEIKEVRMSVNIDTNDLNTKINNALRFLKNGDKVKVSVRFRGREMAHQNLGQTLLLNFAAQCEEFGSMDKPPKMEGRTMSLFLLPKAAK